jgi:transposase, IS5 family
VPAASAGTDPRAGAFRPPRSRRFSLQIGDFGGVGMLRLAGGQVESLFDDALPVEVRELPEDLAALDALLGDWALLAPIERAWAQAARDHGRPTIPMATLVRLMVVKQRTGGGYEALVREVSDSLHLRRFCLIGLAERVPDESTVRKLVRRLGPEVVNAITRAVIGKAEREERFRARAVRIDSTVVEADVRYPSDAVLALQGAKALAREGRRLGALLAGNGARVVERSRRSARRSGRSRARSRAAPAAKLEQLASDCERVAGQIEARLRGEKITNRIVSLADTDASRSARASSASRTSSATSPRSPRSPPGPAAAPAATCCPPRQRPATPARTRSCPTPSQNSNGFGTSRARSRSTAPSAT